MAKKSQMEKMRRKQATVLKYAAKRAELKAAGDYVGLAELPRDASPTRHRNRCLYTGRPQAFLRYFGMSRLTFREMAHKGQLPGVKKASW
jgi:small subunit ribosomal protein S14